MIEFSGLLLGVVAVVFAFETPRTAFVRLFRHQSRRTDTRTGISPKQTASSSKSSVGESTLGSVSGAVESGREPFFISQPHTDIESALAMSRSQKKPVFLVIYNREHPTQSKLYYSLGCFLDYFTTKKLLEDHFVSALVPSQSEAAKKLVPLDNPLENCLWVVLDADGQVHRREGVYANADEGLKRVREVVAQLGDA